MKVNYFAYYMMQNATQSRIKFDIRPLLKEFCRFDQPKFKASFRHNDEYLYLLPHLQDTYLFVITRSNEVIRKINTNDTSIGEIHNLLQANEHIGFASYVLIKDNFIGYCSTSFAPKMILLTQYINELLEKLGIINYSFHAHPLTASATKSEAINMPFIGKTSIEITPENGFFSHVLEQLGADISSLEDIGGLEITIKPLRGKNLKEPVTDVLNSLSDDGVKKMITKAKGDMYPHLTDLYLVGQGAITDNITKKQEEEIATALNDKASSNRRMQRRLMEFQDDANFQEDSCNDVLRYHNDNAWADLLSTLQGADSVKQ